MNKWIAVIGLLIFCSCKTPPFTRVAPVGSNQTTVNASDKFIFFVHSNSQINGRITMDNLVRLSSHISIQGYLYTQGNRLLLSNWDTYRNKLLQDNYRYGLIMYLRPLNSDAQNDNEGAFIKDYLLFIDPCLFNPTCNTSPNKFVIESKLYSLETGNCIWQSSSITFENVDVQASYLSHAEQVVQQLKQQKYMLK